MFVDYRKLNKVTINDQYPLPNIEDLIANIGSSKFITTLNLMKGYYQVPGNLQHREKTAFVTPYGKYEFFDDALWVNFSTIYLPKVNGWVVEWVA